MKLIQWLICMKKGHLWRWYSTDPKDDGYYRGECTRCGKTYGGNGK